MKRISRDQNVVLWVVSSKTVCSQFQENGVKAHYKIVPHFIKSESYLGEQIIDSIVRSIYVCVAPIHIRNDTVMMHSPTDFLWDTFPAFIKKFLNKEIKWFASVYHIIPHPSERPGGFNLSNLISFISQRLSLLLIARWSDMIQTETSFVRDELVKRYRISSGKIAVCQSGINPKAIDNLPLSKGKIFDACFLARLHKSKGIFDLIEAWKCVCNHNQDAKLAIAGGGPIEIINEIKSKIKSSDLEKNVSYLGFLSEAEKYQLIRASKLYVLPSYEEGIPITFYEAMYCGIPVLTYYLPTYSDIRDYIICAPLGNVKILADQILRVLDDEELTRALCERGKKEASVHTWDKVADCIISEVGKINTRGN